MGLQISLHFRFNFHYNKGYLFPEGSKLGPELDVQLVQLTRRRRLTAGAGKWRLLPFGTPEDTQTVKLFVYLTFITRASS